MCPHACCLAKNKRARDAEIRKQYLKNVENLIVELKSIDNFEERKRLIDEYIETNDENG